MKPIKGRLKQKAASIRKMGFIVSDSCMVEIQVQNNGDRIYVDLSATDPIYYLNRIVDAIYRRGKQKGIETIQDQLKELLTNNEF